MSITLSEVNVVDFLQLDQGFFDHFGVEYIDGEYVSSKILVKGRKVPFFVGWPDSTQADDRSFPSISITFIGSYNDKDRLESHLGGVILEDNGSVRTITEHDPLPQLAYYRVESYARTNTDMKELTYQLLAAFPTDSSIKANNYYWYMFRQEHSNVSAQMFNQRTYRYVMDIMVAITILPSFATRTAYAVKTLDMKYYVENKLQHTITIGE